MLIYPEKILSLLKKGPETIYDSDFINENQKHELIMRQ